MSEFTEYIGKRWNGRILESSSGGKRLSESATRAVTTPQEEPAQAAEVPAGNTTKPTESDGGMPRPYHYD